MSTSALHAGDVKAALRRGAARLELGAWEQAEEDLAGRCRLPVSKPVLKAPMVSALETKI